MRLGTCIALELALAAGGVGGLVIGIGHAVDHAGEYFVANQAVAATASSAARVSFEPLPAATLTLPEQSASTTPAATETVFGAPDAELLAPVGEGAVTRVKVNHGGTSLSLRLDFASGARAAFKPEQIHMQSDPRREIAAYRIDRLLGIGHVQPTKSFSVRVDELVAAADPGGRAVIADRLANEAKAKNGVLRGELSWWIADIKLAQIGGVQVDDFAARNQWTRMLKVGAQVPEDQKEMLAQLATLAVFDVIIDNPDRWSGGNTRMSPDGKILYFMDNSMSFSKYEFGHENNLVVVRRMQVFPRGLIERLRTLTLEQLTASVTAGGEETGLAPLLSTAELAAIIKRRDNLLIQVDALIAQYGDAAVLALP
ncbi:MAG TPA: hypothetical protein VGM90_01095 [Kofleriaceae bacterium]